jgi:hypothetical protein
VESTFPLQIFYCWIRRDGDYTKKGKIPCHMSTITE